MDRRCSAACGSEDPDLFFPVGASGPSIPRIERAKTVCRRCPVKRECLDWAMETGQDGVWEA
ncbi:WhiB family transcriptional regulator [Embleya scabrispora]|uniref:WhiB family transcriptional regulator n=1 Tax=Embleya scabrispora TaxID=159449 RepID=UPI00039FFA8F